LPRHKKFLHRRETRPHHSLFLFFAPFFLQRTNPRSLTMTDVVQPDPAQAISHLGESLTQTAESQRLLAKQASDFAKDESLRFVNLRLERNGAALDKLQHCAGLPGLIGVQQEWMRDFLQDYTSQSMRLMGAMRGLTQNALSCAVETASDNIDRMQQQAGETMNRAGEAINQAGEQMAHVAQETNAYVQETTH
jgi:hypothetical protein